MGTARLRERLVLATALVAAPACTSLLGVDFEGRLVDDARGDGGEGGAADVDVTSDGPALPPEASAAEDAGPADADVDLAWTRWPVSGAFPGDQTTVVGGTVTDRVTGLVWTQAPLASPLSFGEAPAACDALELGGFSDWRMPTRIELLSLVSYIFTPATAADLALPDAETWTASPAAGDPARAWTVVFATGASAHRSVSDPLHVRCVRGGRRSSNGPEHRFVAAFGTVFDKETNLTWQAATTASGTFAQATTHCQKLVINGVDGFRVPDVHELHSIVDERRSGPALDPRFTDGSLAWSRTRVSGSADQNWTVEYYDGRALVMPTSSSARVRCVK